MKMPHIDEEKELYALPIQGSVQDFLFGGGVDPKKIFGATQRRENFFRACKGSRGMLTRKILKT